MKRKNKSFGPFQGIIDEHRKVACYRIIRFRQNGGNRTIKTGFTEQEAQAWCKRADTRGPGWFDGYMKGVKS